MSDLRSKYILFVCGKCAARLNYDESGIENGNGNGNAAILEKVDEANGACASSRVQVREHMFQRENARFGGFAACRPQQSIIN